MAVQDDKVGHVRAYLEYFRDMGVHEFYRNDTIEPMELAAAAVEPELRPVVIAAEPAKVVLTTPAVTVLETLTLYP